MQAAAHAMINDRVPRRAQSRQIIAAGHARSGSDPIGSAPPRRGAPWRRPANQSRQSRFRIALLGLAVPGNDGPGSTPSALIFSAIGGQEGAYRHAYHVVNALLSRRRREIEQHGLEQGCMAAFDE